MAPTLIRLFIWDVAVTIFYFMHQSHFQQFELPLTLFGTALALFLGFRSNAAYARWWEARALWGQIINASRNLARQFVTLLDNGSEKGKDLGRELILRQIAFAHSLRCVLREQEWQTDCLRFLNPEEVSALKTRANVPYAILNGSANRLAEAARLGLLDPLLWMRIDTTLGEIVNAQGGIERIKKTPMPMHFRSFPTIFVEIFCLILPFVIVQDLGLYTPIGSTLIGLMLVAALQVGNDLKDPFENGIHDVPILAICRTIEIDLLQILGEPAPEPLAPINGILM
jgi:putative membrane protein